MRPSHATELAAAVAAALEQLDQYRMLLEELIRSPDDQSLYRRNSDAFDAMGGLTASLPQIRVCWVEVLISRFELLDAMGRATVVDRADGRLARVYEKHLTTLESFHRLCWQYISTLIVAPQRREAPPRSMLQIAQRRVLEAERRVKHQRDLIQQLEAHDADASDAHRLLRTMEKVLEVMYFNLNVARQRSG
ncbi:hypothetical protein EZ313_19290 [Ramlibacter henchirensis]|uniref:Uncharacterized protein n=1 Tax=Ramlibacter henchirensis TaxID=204072 RepID=A0A4Z0BP54_9BURK|nr:hypothetical protein [Ramlibacter henchirensis]TFZ00601.1 hypothetical protein EZ313_19290 [Ramlibacter henchirensis]